MRQAASMLETWMRCTDLHAHPYQRVFEFATTATTSTDRTMGLGTLGDSPDLSFALWLVYGRRAMLSVL